MSNRNKICATISGSFNKHFQEIKNKIIEFKQNEIEVLSPKLGDVLFKDNGFTILERNKGAPIDIEYEHLLSIARSDFLYVVNPEGYIGNSVSFEIGYALSKGIPIYALEKPVDYVISFFVKQEESIEKLKSIFENEDIILLKKIYNITGTSRLCF
jgi:nucleoside 2-deoxyribosyltransferase